MDKIIIRGAKENNLKNIDVELPRDKFIVFTGLSGSGKSSLAFDTIYAEGQRRYVESLSSYARQFLGQMEKPDVEFIEGLSPAISIDQKTTNRNPRSTVGTVTEIYDYFRLLFARVGTPHCPKCGKPITTQTIDQITDQILEYEEKTRIQILAPLVRGAKGTHKKVLSDIKKDGYVRVRVDGEIIDLDDEISIAKNKKHNIEVVIDRIIIKDGIQKRLVDSVETALLLSEGMVLIDVMGQQEYLMSTKFACTDCGIGFGEISPRMFSFNNPFGMCETCNGLGIKKEIDIDLIIPDWTKSIADRAITPYGADEDGYYYQIFKAIGDYYDFDVTRPISDAPKEFLDEVLYGTNGREITIDFVSKFQGPKVYTKEFEGVVKNLERRYIETHSAEMRERIEEYMDDTPCPDCHGARLNDISLAVKIGDKNIYEVTKLSVVKLLKFFSELNLSEKQRVIGEQILKEINSRLNFLSDVGLTYLTLDRNASTLSGGESQRIRLATQIGSSLVGVLYVLDEPSIGLHQRDNSMLIKTLRNLTDLGNTLIVVEHDEETMESSDYILDIGPGAGVHGGEIVAQGTFEDIKNSEHSITGQYLSGRKKIEVPDSRRQLNDKFIEIKGARENNLKNIDVKIPLGMMCCITGVSGSGKSSLINEILCKRIHQKLFKNRNRPGKYDEMFGVEHIDKIISIDQSPIGRTPRSNPATYTGVFDYIRDIFSMTLEAKERGYKKGRFSFNVKGGRCEACRGDGILKIEMHFLPDVYVPCEVCKGKRYNRETLEVKYKGKNISDVLDMTVEEALDYFENIPKIKNKIQTMMDVGLGYIKLGQPSTELSGGEAQRIKLAYELSKRSTGKTLYVLDEPTTGLHIADIHMLIEVLNRLVEAGNSVVVIEHNLDVIKTADYIIDLGPEGGDGGGTIVAQGTPEEVAKVKKSYTGQYLKKML
ncbi:excinuclease ABC subunit A [Sedimentibacter acidaminivorans]|uniref:UvrABC system protein A n=1 Tax=Sedimentibacter acidaminivorans TaxID=913099 RepID=A0ABS4GGE8_9FIRM|nr:excinuclease ABC subunit UvrA [Sedimentibacter acidaminivorans]MBP1926773.1 excinuclease ABC subunit A [Sedimentibacter acidaminivorans]